MPPAIPTGIYPFWFWNGRLCQDEIRRQVKEMADKGIRGFFIHCRQGLVQPYLSRVFLDMVEAAVHAAEDHGLLVHLYDEFPYPSGIAGGEVVLGHPEYYATRLVQRAYSVPGGHTRLELPPGELLCAAAYPAQDDRADWATPLDLRDCVGTALLDESYNETGLTSYSRKRYFASGPTPVLEAELPDGPHRVFVGVQSVVTGHKYWNHYVDVLNPEAVRRFIALTHERYHARFSDRFGKSIVSIFVDETAPGWSSRIPAAFRAEHGYDLCERLPALQDTSHPEHLKVSADLYRLRYRMFCEAFEEPVASWCRNHGIAYSGEKSAVRLSQTNYMDIPGCDPGHTKAGARLDMYGANPRRNARSTASAAYFYGKSGALDECFHSMGWSATLQDAKVVSEGLLLNGIAYLVPHGFFYTTHGLAKHDAPPTFFYQMPYWPHFRRLTERLEKIWSAFAGTHIDASVLLVEPRSGLPNADDDRVYEQLQFALLANHLEFLAVDTDLLQSGRIDGQAIHVRDVAARVVVVPPMRLVEPPLQTWLDAFGEAGGTVVYCQDDVDAAIEKVARVAPRSLSITQDGAEVSQVHVVRRVSDDRTLWFLLNVSAESCAVVLDASTPVREVTLDHLPQGLRQEGGRFVRDIAPFESVLLEASDRPVSPTRRQRVPVRLSAAAAVHAHTDNLLRMYEWEMALEQEGAAGAPSAVVPAVPLANQLEKGGFRFAPAFRQHFGQQPDIALPDLTVRYVHRFQVRYEGPVSLVMEPESIRGDWRISVNGGRAMSGPDFVPAQAHVAGSLGVDITESLAQGENAVAVEVRTNRLDGGLRNALYLAGNFAVSLDGNRPCLTERVEHGRFEAYRTNGLPYYAGVVDYTTSFDLDVVPCAEEVVLELEYELPFHEATEVSVNSSPFQPVLWSPRVLLLRSEHLRAGSNTMLTRVYTTLIRSFEGTWFDQGRHAHRDVAEGP